MPQDRNTWEESSELFRARDDDESPRHDVGGAINELLTERTGQEAPPYLEDADGARIERSDPAEVEAEIGLDVLGSCGNKVGEVVDVREDHLVVEKGFLVPEDVYVPKTAIAGTDEHHVFLNVTREVSESSGWEKDPEGIDDEDVIEDVDERL
jgi:hypothetical protein